MKRDVTNWVCYRHWLALYKGIKPLYKTRKEALTTLVIVWYENDSRRTYGYRHRSHNYIVALEVLIGKELHLKDEKAEEWIKGVIKTYSVALNGFRSGIMAEKTAQWRRSIGDVEEAITTYGSEGACEIHRFRYDG